MKALKSLALATLFLSAFSITSCRETNPGKDEEADMGMTSDSIFGRNDTINNNVSTEGADTEMDGE